MGRRCCEATPYPARAARRLWRLAEGADEGAAHPLRIAKAGGFSDALDRLAGDLGMASEKKPFVLFVCHRHSHGRPGVLSGPK
jgi:hypothetical protein